MSTVSEIAPDVYRISTFAPDYGMQFNQFLVTDDEPFLMHTGFRQAFETTRAAVASVLPPERLRWIGFSHYEADECGALNQWLAVAPRAQALCSFVGAMTSVNDFASRPPRILADGETVPLGHRRLRFLSTPHLPHCWDAGLFVEETERTLFCSDLFFQPGDPEPLAAGVLERARDAIAAGRESPFAKDLPYTADTDPMMQRLAALAPRTLAVMHGSSLSGDGARAVRELAGVLRELLAGDTGAQR
jgi:flavorubredoxin